MSGALDRLERSRTALEEGRAGACLRLLPSPRSLPALLRPERDFLAAEAERSMGFFRRAEALYRRALSAAAPEEDPALHAEAALGSAAGLRSLGMIAQARRRLAQARAAARRASWKTYAPRLRLEEALVERAAGRYGPAIRELRAILRQDLARRDWRATAFTLWAIGGAERFRGGLGASERAFRSSLELARRTGDQEAEGYACFGLGGVTRIRGKLRESERWYARAEKLFRGSEDLFARAYAACGLANALRQQGRFPEAEALYRRSHGLYARLGDEVDLAYVDWGLGELRLRRGDLARALPCLQRARKAFIRHGEARGVVLAGLSLAQAFHALGRTAEAEPLFQQAWRLARRAGLHAHLELFT